MPLAPDATSRSVTVLGSTGSVGQSAVKLLEAHRDRFCVEALTAYANAELLARQAISLGAEYAIIGDEHRYDELKTALAGSKIKSAAGAQAVIDAAAGNADIVLAAIVGAAGLMPTMAAIKRGAIVALANKETLVCAGSLVMDAVSRHGATLIPVDSEHSAIFQVFDFARPETVSKLIITASGGPFRTFSAQQMRHVTREQALRHPTWSMGAKISIDSATMMNKGLEVIEAYHLFPVKSSQIEVIIHPESIVHSMVAYQDGSVLAQMGVPDMSAPIAYALAWPGRIAKAAPPLDFSALGSLHFEAPDYHRFPALALSRQALETGGSAPATLNAANEVAVAKFLAGAIGFQDIANVIASTLAHCPNKALQSLEDVLEIDATSRETAEKLCNI